MKIARFANLIIIAALLAAVGTGCRKGPGYVTPIPKGRLGAVKDPGASGMFNPGGTEGAGVKGSDAQGFPQMDPTAYENWKADSEALKQYTVYYAFDSSAIRSSEKAKIAAVADYLKSHTSPRTAVRVEGNCDERGTEEYNRALGDRRAQAAREELIAMGIEPTRIVTISYGEDRPAVQGHDEAAWSKNRRSDFVLLTEP